jgi:hypothetical protein
MDTRWPSEKVILLSNEHPEPIDIVVTADRDLYSSEADTVDRHIVDRQAPAMSWEHTLGNVSLPDLWRREIDLTHEQDGNP